MNKRILLKNGHVVLPDKIINAHVVIENGIITYVGAELTESNSDTVFDVRDKYIMPGFIDAHTNGAAGFDLSAGLFDPTSLQFSTDMESVHEGLSNALMYFLSKGSTKVGLTSIASPVDQLEKNYSKVNDCLNNGYANGIEDVFAGIYVEGTFMKMLEYRGAHNPDYFYPPSIELFEKLQQAAGGRILVVNIPPEHDERGLELVEYLSGKGIIVAAGHTGANARQYEKAVEKGLSLAVHFLNGPTSSSTKSFHGGGAVEAILRLDDVYAELIADGYHVSPEYVLNTIMRKGVDKTVVITDSMFLTGVEDITFFEMFGIKGQVSQNKEYLQVRDSKDTLFGSILTMDKAFSNVLTWLTRPMKGIWYPNFEALDFNQAIVETSKMCSQVPAKALGIYQQDRPGHHQDNGFYTGSIEPGKKADLLVTSINETENGYILDVEKVFLKGTPIV